MFTVVMGVDTDENRASAQANAVAELPGSDGEIRAILVHVFESNPEGASVEQVAAVREAREILEAADVQVELRGTGGEPAEAILHIADSEDANRIVLAGRKRTPAGKALFGSTTQNVVLNSDRPVLVCTGNGDD